MLTVQALDNAGVPRPDGTALGDALHVLSCYRGEPDDRVVLTATINVYEADATTGLSLGDLRELVELAKLGIKVRRVMDDAARELEEM